MDRINPPLGLRRGWMLFAQLCLIGSIGALGSVDRGCTSLVATIAVVIAAFSATQTLPLMPTVGITR